MLSFMLNITRVNTQSIYCLNNGLDGRTGVNSFEFGCELGMVLVKSQSDWQVENTEIC